MSTGQEPSRISKQLRQQRRRQAAGLCRNCGARRGEASSALCDTCLDRQRDRMRQRGGYEPWKPGGAGRPPKPRHPRPDTLRAPLRNDACDAAPGREGEDRTPVHPALKKAANIYASKPSA